MNEPNEVKPKKKPVGDKARLKRRIARLEEEMTKMQEVIYAKNNQITSLSKALAGCACYATAE